jgi:hypothetical protein
VAETIRKNNTTRINSLLHLEKTQTFLHAVLQLIIKYPIMALYNTQPLSLAGVTHKNACHLRTPRAYLASRSTTELQKKKLLFQMIYWVSQNQGKSSILLH